MLKFAVLALVCGAATAAVDKSVRWSGGSDFEWPNEATRSLFKSSGKYVAKNVIATRAAIFKDVAFLALPRYRQGVPATLAKISLKNRRWRSPLTPFPNWQLQEEGNCEALQSAVDIFLDAQEILWVLDVGIVDYLEQPEFKCPPKVVAINAKSGKVLKVIEIGHLSDASSRLQYLVADYGQDGRGFVYVSDAANRAILVLDVLSDRGYRLMLPTDVTDGCSRRDVLYLNLAGDSLLFSYLGGRHMFSVGTGCLRNGTRQVDVKLIGPKRGKVVFLGSDNTGSVFYRMKGGSDIYRWNFKEDGKSVRRIYKGSPYALPTQVVAERKRGKLWLLESNFPDFFAGTVGCGVDHALRMIE